MELVCFELELEYLELDPLIEPAPTLELERCQTGERQLGEWILANGRMEKTGYGQMEEWYDHLSNICSQCQ